jgi:hypothetical protein
LEIIAMNRRLPSFLFAAGLFLLPLLAPAQTSPPGPLDYYKLGQFFGTTANSIYLAAYPTRDALREKLANERANLVKLGATPAVLNSYDSEANVFSDLPFTTAWPSWTKDQQNSYINSSMDWSAVNTWLGGGDSTPHFYFWLGYQIQFLAKTGPSELNVWGYSLASVQSAYKTPLADFGTFATGFPGTFKTALPSIQNAITAIAAFNGKTPGASDITALQRQAQIIYDAANGKITQ